MSLQKAVLSIGVVAIWVSGCTIGDPGGGGGGGVNFHAGYTFIRSGEVYLSDRSDYTRVVQLTSTGNNHNPSISPDGSRVVFVHGSGNSSEVDTIAVNASGVAPTRVYAADSTHTNLRMPVFSRDGTFIVFAYESGGSSFLGRVNRDGSGFQRITSGRSYSAPSFYSDGLRVLASGGSFSGRYDSLETISLATGAATLVTNIFPQGVQGIANRAVISPNGSTIAVDFTTSSGVSRVFSYDIGGRRFNPLTNYPGAPSTQDSFPSWVGEDLIGFSSDFGNNDSIYEISRIAIGGSGTLKLASAVEPSYGP